MCIQKAQSKSVVTSGKAESLPVRPAKRSEVGTIAAFIVQHFFCDGDPSIAGLIARATLERQQENDLRNRYLKPLHDAQLLVLKSASGSLLGCCGFETLAFDGVQQIDRAQQSTTAGYVLRPLISNLVVQKDARGFGYGSLLMDAVEQSLADRGYDESLLLVAASNKRARQLYRKRGYKVISRASYDGLEVEDKRFVTREGVSGVYMRKSLKGGLLGLLGM